MKKGRCRIETTDPVGMRIKELIAQYSTMTEVSLQLDVPYKVVRGWIVGDVRPQGKTLEKLAKIHPKRRFYIVEFDDGFRESYLLREDRQNG